MSSYILSIDQGTTSTRAIVYDDSFAHVSLSQEEYEQHYPSSGWVEHAPDDIIRSVLNTCGKAIDQLSKVCGISSIGITNQRETTVVWNRHTGKPVYPAIVWQDRRTANFCDELRAGGCEEEVTERTGLLLDPYFSATKIRWILDNVDGARRLAHAGDLLFGTIDTYIVWVLTGGKSHVTDATNAARTMLCNLDTGNWDEEMLGLLDIPRPMLPEIRNSADYFGTTDPGVFGHAIPIEGIAGDQQAATIGQCCLDPGMMKSTYGTGCFALINTGSTRVRSGNRLLSTIAYQIEGKRTYALEGSIFSTGSTIQWLKDGLGIIDTAAETLELARQADLEQQVYLVPAFTGLGAPYWDANCRGALFGLTRNSGPAEIARAALESVAFQTNDLIEAMRGDIEDVEDVVLRVDGGMAVNDWAMQAIANIADVPVDRPKITETTSLGAAYLAGLQSGLFDNLQEMASNWHRQNRFVPEMEASRRAGMLSGWRRAVGSTIAA